MHVPIISHTVQRASRRLVSGLGTLVLLLAGASGVPAWGANLWQRIPSIPTTPLPCMPDIYSVSYATPSQGAFMERGWIVYLEGNTLDIRVEIPACAYAATVTSDTLGGDDFRPSATPEVPWTTVSNVAAGADRRHIVIRITVANDGTGRAEQITVKVGGQFSNTTVDHSFTLSGVSKLAAPVREFSVAQNEIWNHLVAGAYAGTFGTDVTPLYKNFVVDSRPDGIRVEMQLKKHIPNFCDAVIKVAGRMHPLLTDTGVEVHWAAGPDASLSLGWCTIPASVLTPVYIVAKALYESSAEQAFRKSVEEALKKFLPEDDCGLPCNLIITDIVPWHQEVVVQLNEALLPTGVTIEVPYQSLHETSTWGAGLPINGGETVFVTASGTVEVCQLPGSISNCASHRLGPAGLFNWNVNPPVPDPWQLHFTQYAYYKERAEARAALRGLTRTASQLPRPEANAGMLIARVSGNSSVMQMDRPCALTMPSVGEARVAFSANDIIFSGYGSGRFYVTVLWPDTVPPEYMKALSCGWHERR